MCFIIGQMSIFSLIKAQTNRLKNRNLAIYREIYTKNQKYILSLSVLLTVLKIANQNENRLPFFISLMK